MLFPSAVHASNTIESGAPRSYVERYSPILRSPLFSEPHECYCLALFMHPPPSSLDPREVMRSAVRQFSILHFFRSPMNLLPSAVHASTTNESGAP